MTLRKRHHTFFFVQALVTVTVLTACRSDTAEEVESETVVSVKTAVATRGDIQAVIHATGVVTPAPGAELVVVAPEAARIAELPRATGDRVRRGDLLVRFEIPTAAAEVQRQRAEVGRALASLENAKAAQARATALFERGVAARKEVEDSNRAVADAEAALTQARASVAASEALANRAIVRATFDGVIARRLHNPGDLVEPTVSDPVLRVVDPRRLEVVASVPVTDATTRRSRRSCPPGRCCRQRLRRRSEGGVRTGRGRAGHRRSSRAPAIHRSGGPADRNTRAGRYWRGVAQKCRAGPCSGGRA